MNTEPLFRTAEIAEAIGATRSEVAAMQKAYAIKPVSGSTFFTKDTLEAARDLIAKKRNSIMAVDLRQRLGLTQHEITAYTAKGIFPEPDIQYLRHPRYSNALVAQIEGILAALPEEKKHKPRNKK